MPATLPRVAQALLGLRRLSSQSAGARTRLCLRVVAVRHTSNPDLDAIVIRRATDRFDPSQSKDAIVRPRRG